YIGLLFFFVATGMTTVDAPSRLVNGLYEMHILSGKLNKKGDKKGNIISHISFSTIDEVNKICDAYPELEFFKINRDLGGLFSVSCEGIAEISQKTIQSQKLLYGEIPSDLNDFFVNKTFAEKLIEYLPGKWAGDPNITGIEDLVDYYYVTVYDKVFTLRGIVEDSYLPYTYAYFNEGFLNSIPDVYEKAKIEGYCSYLYFTMSGNFKTDYKFFKAYHGDDLYHKTKSKYVIKTSLSDHFYRTMATDMGMADWFYGISAILLLFVILIHFSISMSIRKNQKKNSILQALGYSNFDLLKIFLLQITLPFILLIPLVSVSGYYIINAFNASLLKNTSRLYGLFKIGALNIVWFLLLCVGIVVISASLSMIKLFKKQPKNTIESN
ncbi:MAG: ABC transporter permease, partial [Anaeroplasmataceae bacterium]|nr:ABC transporter permease [Anaeroplasmataceae bacterium]